MKLTTLGATYIPNVQNWYEKKLRRNSLFKKKNIKFEM